MLSQANESLEKGEKAITYEERKENLNQALFLYHSIEKEADSPSLNRTIGDIYFQLGEYPWSILYYEKALKGDKSDSLAAEHLQMVKQKLGLKTITAQKPFSFHYPLLLGAIFLTFLIVSLSIWFRGGFFRKFAAYSSAGLLILLINWAYFYYTTPIEGILILSSGLYQAPSKTESNTSLVLAGSKVTILQITSNGEWLKIENGGLVGYIPSDHLRIF